MPASRGRAPIADKFSIAAERYRHDPIALQLRSMNLLYEGMKERGTLMIVPSSLTDAAGIGSYAGLAALGGTAPLGGAPPLGGTPPTRTGG